MPCFKRPDYTAKCIWALETCHHYFPFVDFYLVDDGSNDGTFEILEAAKLPNKVLIHNPENIGLRDTIINFLRLCQIQDYAFIAKMDNDCAVPINWIGDIVDVFNKCPEVEILSPNVHPSNAAFVYGKKVEGLQYMPAKLVGGLWFMRGSLIKGIDFDKYDTDGLTGAIALLAQIVNEKSPVIGWLPKVIVEDMGHWSGTHPEHIKSKDHAEYSKIVGRDVAWTC